MATRWILTAKGEKALKDLMAKIKSQNSALSRFQNSLVNQALIDLSHNLTEGKLRSLADNLMSIQGKRKMLMERLETISRELDEAAFSSFESGVKKVCNQFEKKEMEADQRSIRDV